MRTTFKTSANGRGDSFPGFGLSGSQDIGISGYREGGLDAATSRVAVELFCHAMPEGKHGNFPTQCPAATGGVY